MDSSDFELPAKRLSTPEQLSAAIRQLPRLSQVILFLHYRENHSMGQIAAYLQMSQARAQVALAQAQQQLMAIDWRWLAGDQSAAFAAEAAALTRVF